MHKQQDDRSVSERIERAKQCLTLISKIASRGASSDNPEHVGYALEELTQVMFERTGSEERVFEPVPADQIQDLESLHSELDFVESCLDEMSGGPINEFRIVLPPVC